MSMNRQAAQSPPQPCHDDRMENSSVKTIATSKPSQRPHESSLSSSSPEVSVPTVTLLPTQEAKTGTDVSQHELKQRRFSRQASGAVEIALDGAEEQLFRILVETVRAYESGEIELSVEQLMTNQERRESCADIELDYPRPVQLDVRVAGGWVRDKLLGLQTHDVDIAINRLTGVQFASLVQQYLKREREKEVDTQCEKANNKEHNRRRCSKMGVIAANPDQSKHLETATMKVCGIEVDFCNLRAEEMYQADSRIPLVKFGSPHEDANRRDFTVNALFYNLKTSCVEDWTGRGLADLEKAQLVTPLDPLSTFSDDPLRVLRAIRFAVRYNFSLDVALERAAMCQSIHKALHVKVSRERVGKELEGMLSGKGANPVAALDTIARLKLAGSVFCVPKAGEDRVAVISGCIADRPYEETWQCRIYDTPEARNTREIGWKEARTLLHLLPAVQAAFVALVAERPAPATTLDTRLLPVAVFLLPFRTMYYQEVNKGKSRNETNDIIASGKSYSAATYVVREGIKFKNKDVAAMITLQETVDRMAALLEDCVAASAAGKEIAGTNLDRLATGLLLRSTKGLWLTSLALATVLKTRDKQQQQQRRQQGQQQKQVGVSNVDWVKVSCAAYKAILDLNLDESWKLKPLLDGKAVIATLELPRGPTVGTFLDEQVKWMLQHPTGSVHDCREYLLSFKRRQEEQEQVRDQCVGVSDGVAPSSTVQGGKTVQHFSKRMHVESRLDNTPSSRGS